MPLKTYLMLLAFVILVAGVTVSVASVFWVQVGAPIGLAFVALVGLKLYQMHRQIEAEKNDRT